MSASFLTFPNGSLTDPTASPSTKTSSGQFTHVREEKSERARVRSLARPFLLPSAVRGTFSPARSLPPPLPSDARTEGAPRESRFLANPVPRGTTLCAIADGAPRHDAVAAGRGTSQMRRQNPSTVAPHLMSCARPERLAF